MKKNKFLSFITLLFTLLLLSCSSDDGISKSDLNFDTLFSYETDGLEVAFKNESAIEGTYNWDFGDNLLSTDENPVHTYARKGSYYVTLSVTDASGKETDVFTKLKVDKNSKIDLDDDSFDDWDNINEAFAPIKKTAGVVKSLKYDYDSNFIYFYIKTDTEATTDYQILNMMIDVDPGNDTGFTYDVWPLFEGAEVLLENSFSGDRVDNDDYYWLDFANFDPEGTDWDTMWIYDGGETEDAQIDGTYHANGSIIEIEFAISRTKIKFLNGVDLIKIAGWTSDEDWNENGWFPNKMPDDADASTPLADGLVIDMN